ncbi:MAG TPA: 4-amino-4-deoxy-L-arabinose transferase [Nocardioidaceae bacterium]|nr:4-amino-4-deoxy-L-arabinose transferase [Nocardioidaceae bacterium]
MTPHELAAAVAAAPPRLGRTRLICVEGRAGAGKTTLSDAVATAYAETAAVVHLDDLYEGWAGLPTIGVRIRDELLPSLAAGRRASIRRWDWAADRLGAPLTVPVVDALLLEGVGSYARDYDDAVSLVIWVDAPDDVRRDRALTRDGDVFAPYWDQWAADEATVHARERTRERADVVVAV